MTAGLLDAFDVFSSITIGCTAAFLDDTALGTPDCTAAADDDDDGLSAGAIDRCAEAGLV